jgi:hypothetical protein
MYRFTPETIDNLFCDNKDYKGLYYWYEDAKEYSKELQSLT